MNSMQSNLPDDFERRLAELSLVEPSSDYKNLVVALKEERRMNWGMLLSFSFSFLLLVGLAFEFGPILLGEDSQSDIDVVNLENSSGESLNEVAIPAQAERYLLGAHYTELETPILMDSKLSDTVGVFFTYPCFPCYEFTEILEDWRDTRSSQFEFTYVPAIWSDSTRYYAQIFYASEILGVLDSAQSQIFEAIHQDGELLENLPNVVRFFSSLGISQERFLAAFNSEEALDRVSYAEQMNSEFRIQAAPTLIVDCRYRITPNSEVDHTEMLEVANFLVHNRQIEGSTAC